MVLIIKLYHQQQVININNNTDAGSNIVKCFKLMKLKNIHCLSHVLHLIITNNIETIEEIKTKIKDLVNLFNESICNWQVIYI
jgi:hypothetical protein